MSVGHVARLLEEGGISTVLVAVRAFRHRLEMMSLPRVMVTPYLMGRPVGPVGDREKQMKTIRAALELFQRAEKAGTVLDLPALSVSPQ